VVASRLASGFPAEVLDLRRELGAVETGLAADLVLLDADLSVRRVWYAGRAVEVARDETAGVPEETAPGGEEQAEASG
jgi:adenine deaminase